MLFGRNKTTMVAADAALPGQPERPFEVPATHHVLGTPLEASPADGLEVAYFGLGCFWGAERAFWTLDGVVTTAVGYQGGYTPNPTYEEVCTGRTGHAEIVKVVYDPERIGYADLLRVFFESHDPTQGMRQGNDIGTQYRSAIFTTTPEQLSLAKSVRDTYDEKLRSAGYGDVTTEIAAAGDFWYAEDYHQQYLAKNPSGYCGLAGTGLSCPVGVAKTPEPDAGSRARPERTASFIAMIEE